ncbi:MAG TPA: hypothetical protein VFE63_02585 [Roseiarcus sp.]|jgi:uncharacterized protein (DUF4415 family)|nr:hypothetical protein [Roseiarcus sp.]
MSETKRRRGPTPLTDEEGEVSELTLADFRKMKPIREAVPGLIETRREHPPQGEAEGLGAEGGHRFRVATDLVAHIRAIGRDYSARIEEALREAFMKKRANGAKPEPAAKPAASKRRA